MPWDVSLYREEKVLPLSFQSFPPLLFQELGWTRLPYYSGYFQAHSPEVQTTRSQKCTVDVQRLESLQYFYFSNSQWYRAASNPIPFLIKGFFPHLELKKISDLYNPVVIFQYVVAPRSKFLGKTKIQPSKASHNFSDIGRVIVYGGLPRTVLIYTCCPSTSFHSQSGPSLDYKLHGHWEQCRLKQTWREKSVFGRYLISDVLCLGGWLDVVILISQDLKPIYAWETHHCGGLGARQGRGRHLGSCSKLGKLQNIFARTWNQKQMTRQHYQTLLGQ